MTVSDKNTLPENSNTHTHILLQKNAIEVIYNFFTEYINKDNSNVSPKILSKSSNSVI